MNIEFDSHDPQFPCDSARALEIEGKFYPDGRASDPGELGWMQGLPPPVDKLVTFESDCFLDFPQIRWSLTHMRELAPTANVRRGEGPRILPGTPSGADAAAIDALTFTDIKDQRRYPPLG
ncbi:hypothetical protein [Variovorax sp. LjRoot178]|uniref:hypothetical protein n=1 Tax=Variovorax sp. LjRoot178 TaxID=3342277 RepID=UPI003ECD9D81